MTLLSCSRQITRDLQHFSLNCIFYQNLSNTVRVIVTSKKTKDSFYEYSRSSLLQRSYKTIFLKQKAKQLMKRKLTMQLKLKMNHLCPKSLEVAKAFEVLQVLNSPSLYSLKRQRNEGTKL